MALRQSLIELAVARSDERRSAHQNGDQRTNTWTGPYDSGSAFEAIVEKSFLTCRRIWSGSGQGDDEVCSGEVQEEQIRGVIEWRNRRHVRRSARHCRQGSQGERRHSDAAHRGGQGQQRMTALLPKV